MPRSRRRVEIERAARRSAFLTILGTLIPGAGLTRTRYFRLGWIVLSLVAGVLAALAVAVFSKGAMATALGVAVRPGVLLLAAVAMVLGGLIWVWTIVLTHRGTRDRRFDSVQRSGLRLLTAAMCVLVAVPMATAVRYSLVQRDVIASIFAQNLAGTDGAAAPGEGVDPWRGVPRVTVLLLGSDAGDDREGVRTDSMIIASINAQTGDTVLFSLPRNLQNVPFPASNPLSKLWPKGYNCGSECLLNAVWTEAVNHKDLFPKDPQPGLTTVRGVLSEITGLRIDYTAIVDLKGFESLVDAMGGVTVNVTERLPIAGYHTSSGGLAGIESWIEPGVQKLDGHRALWFARSRLTTDDYSRMRRQRCIVGKIVDQVNPSTMLQKYPELAGVAKDNLQTDIPAGDLPAWVELVSRVKKSQIRSLTFTPENISPGNPNFAGIRKMVKDALDPANSTSMSQASPSPAATPTGPASTKTSTKAPTATPTTHQAGPLTIDEAC
ncbi:MAG TPA: LCP family protein [Dermatophilaceae bacterium]|nr:LCP family protein [Dermatophilaceae bacterium]